MDKIDWKRKLTSRKFWLAVAALIAGIITLLKPGTDTTQITGLILSLGSVVAYIVGEGLVDAASAGADNITITDKQEPTEQGSATEEAAK